MVVSDFVNTSGDRLPVVLRFTPTGGLDIGHGMRQIDLPGTDENVTAVAASGTGLILAGDVATAAASNVDRFVARLDATNAFDSSFGVGGVRTLMAVRPGAIGVALDATTGAIYLGGVTGSNFAVSKLTANGTPDSTFGVGGTATAAMPAGNAGFNDFLREPAAGQFVFGGNIWCTTTGSSDRDLAISRLTSTGAIDTSFGIGGTRTIDAGSTTDGTMSVLLTSTGRLIASGSHVATGSSSTEFVAGAVLDNAIAPAPGNQPRLRVRRANDPAVHVPGQRVRERRCERSGGVQRHDQAAVRHGN